MGGIPTMLLMIAAAGVTYGWQPDKNGDDAADVEYIVQVSPAELAQLQKSGSSISSQISSVIDPEVRGHVSRIVFRIGTGELPRNSPTHLSARRVAALKPAPQGSGGFGFPSSLQNTAADAANGAANQFSNQAIDRAGRTIQNGADQAGRNANNLLDRIRGTTQNPRNAGRDVVPAPSPRPGTNQAGSTGFGNPQPNTNVANQPSSSSPFAQPRAGGPSTAPAGQSPQSGRDNQWSRFAAQQQNPQDASTSLASNGLRPSDTFGQIPGGLQNSGLSNRDTNESLLAARNGREQGNTNSNALGGIYSQIDQTKRDSVYGVGNDAANNRSNPGVQSFQNGNQQPRSASSSSLAGGDYQGNRYLGSSRPNPKLTQDQLAAGGWDLDAYDRLVNRSGQLVRADNRQPSFTDRAGSGNALNGYPSTGNPQQNSRALAPSLNAPRDMANSGTSSNGIYDRSLVGSSGSTQERDAWGRPIDSRDDRQRYMQEQDQLDRERLASNPVTRYPSTNDSNRSPGYQDSRYGNSSSQYSNRDVPERSYTERSYTEQPYPDQRYAGRTDDDDRGTAARPPYDRSASDRQPAPSPANSSTELGPNSSPERLSHAGFSPAGNIPKSKPVAAQPLFNGLLLISIVANLYLMFWLKNLRVQFKDMVTAKRMATSSTSVA